MDFLEYEIMLVLFQGIVVLIILQRLFELRKSNQNIRNAVADGAFLVPEKNYFFMVTLHASWLGCLAYMAIKGSLRIDPIWFVIGLFFLAAGQWLRIQAIQTLGKRWSTQILVFPKKPAIRTGLFNWIRHPNYLGVVLEIAALPIMVGLWDFAVLFSLLNFVILYFRIRVEERVLKKYSFYREVFQAPVS